MALKEHRANCRPRDSKRVVDWLTGVVGVLAVVAGVWFYPIAKWYLGPQHRLCEAAYRGDLRAIDHWIASGVNPHVRDFAGRDAFTYAAEGYMSRRHLHGLTGVHPDLDAIEAALMKGK